MRKRCTSDDEMNVVQLQLITQKWIFFLKGSGPNYQLE